MKRKNGTKKRKHTVGENLKQELGILKKKERKKQAEREKRTRRKKKSGTKKQKSTRNEK
jgi:hypothetical protein